MPNFVYSCSRTGSLACQLARLVAAVAAGLDEGDKGDKPAACSCKYTSHQHTVRNNDCCSCGQHTHTFHDQRQIELHRYAVAGFNCHTCAAGRAASACDPTVDPIKTAMSKDKAVNNKDGAV